MRTLPTSLAGVLVIEPDVHGDHRGFFAETFREDAWTQAGIDMAFVQDNHSRSHRGTLRGMHFQTAPGQAKLVRCARGAIFDVVVDLRRETPTFGRWEGFVLDDESMRQLFVPIGFAHGFCVTSELADVVYKCSSYYDAATESGIAYDDPAIGIEWPIGVEPIVSERDATAPRLADVASKLPF
ncbi:MAG TPA: dTDP-4-dehydrorhamnose 3,5-epimerase [Conexibacter sp.]|nr:dTDP-4-dehydrorhamnose 3,5-epimerase [Conexibacter sp.]